MENKLWLTAFIGISAISFPGHAEEISKHLATVVAPEPIERIHPKYPISAAREGRSGWSRFSFVVEKDGSVSNIVEIDSSGSRDLSIEAKKALAQWRYTPAMENGEPVQQCLNTVQLDFKMENGQDRVRKRFAKKYRKALDALEQQDFSEVEELIEEMSAMRYKFAAESNYLHTVSASYAEVRGDKAEQYLHLSSISFLNDDKKSQDYQLAVLNNRFSLALELNYYRAAYEIYQQLEKLESAKPHLAQYQQVIAKIDEFLASEQELVVSGEIADKDYWHYSLVRNRFSLTDISGRLTKLDVRCANKHHIYTVENNNTWSMPSGWKNCDLYIYGENSSRFTLVEHGT